MSTSIISTKNASHFKWGENCDGWWLKDSGRFTVIYEHMPANSAEVKHYHQQTEQFFYCLQGQLVIELNNARLTLNKSEGLTIEPGVIHQAINSSEHAVYFLVISSPNSHEDRINLE